MSCCAYKCDVCRERFALLHERKLFRLIPYGHQMNEMGLGRAIRAQRRRAGLRQDELAALAGVGNRFVSELEHGKSTAELGRTLRVLAVLGLELELAPRRWRHIEDSHAR